MTASIGKHSRAGVYWTVSLKIVHQSYHVVVMLIAARILGPSAFGVMALALAMVAFAEMFARFGMMKAIVQREHLTPDETYTAFTYCLTASLTASVLLAVLAPGLAVLFRIQELREVLPPLAMLLPILVYYYTCSAFLQRALRFRFLALVGIVEGFVLSTATLVFAICGFGVWALVFAKLIGSGVAVALLIIFAGWTPRLNWHISNIRPMLNYASLELLRQQLRFICIYLPYWLIGYYMTPAALGLLDRARSISSTIVLTFQTQISVVLFPSFTKLQADPGRLKHAFAKILTSVALLMAGPLIGLATVSGIFVPVVLGEEWAPMMTALQVLCVAALFRILASISENLNLATTGYRRQSIVAGVSALATVGSCLAGLPWGVTGVSFGLAVASVCMFAMSISISLQIVGGSPRMLAYCLAPATSGVVLMAGAVWSFRQLIPSKPSAIGLFLLVFVGATVYGLWVLLIRHAGVREIRRDVLGDIRSLGAWQKTAGLWKLGWNRVVSRRTNGIVIDRVRQRFPSGDRPIIESAARACNDPRDSTD